jgi:hypothetical protein
VRYLGFALEMGGGWGEIYLIYGSKTSHWTQKCTMKHDTDFRF